MRASDAARDEQISRPVRRGLAFRHGGGRLLLQQTMVVMGLRSLRNSELGGVDAGARGVWDGS